MASEWRAALLARQSAAQLAAESADGSGRGPTYVALARSLYGAGSRVPVAQAGTKEDNTSLFTNIPQLFLDNLLQHLKPAFLIEVGSWKGGSALRIASAAVAATPSGEPPPCLLCIDTWLGDGGAWIDRCPGWRDGLLLEGGMPQLLWQFLANVRSQQHVILPWPISSLTALRTLQHLAIEQSSGVPRPEFIYLDSAHEKGETHVEMRRAFELLRPGGVLVGDDLDWYAVESDLHAFCDELESGVLVATGCDSLLGGVPHLYPTSHGYWILDSVPRQWVLRKACDIGSSPRIRERGIEGDDDLTALRAAVEAGEYGPEDEREYVPLHNDDREALRVYQCAIALVEQGSVAAASKLFKQAAALSPSVAHHYKLEAFSTSVEHSLKRLALPC